MKASWFMKKLWTGLPCMILSISIAAALHVSPVAAQDAAAEPAAAATDAAAAPPASPTGEFAKDQLEQLVAPIALYPDTVLTQVLMASTYPLEVVEADRFMKKNKGLQGEDLNKALLEQDWDASIKALCSMPDTLAKMSENLDWTQDLGDAFLGQKTELMDTVQRMRGLA
ncbi:MAG TPA: DUF3300 domain-containing protein, partial [Xanthomonadales bacterium]|nr:DUF3300 domain-containing protein [Xanthomonadales bacterium]